MRLLFIQKTTGRGGAKNSLLETLAAIQRSGKFEPSVLVGEPGIFTERCDAIGVPTHVVPLPEWRKFFQRLQFPSAMKRNAALFPDRRIDWVISNEMWWAPHAAAIARHLGCRSAVILRDGIATVEKAIKYRLAANDLILPVSSTIAEALALNPAMAARTHVLFNSVRLPAAGDGGPTLAGRLAARPVAKRWLLVLGRVCQRKNQADAVRVLRLLIDSGHSDLGLILAGDCDEDYAREMDRAITASEVRDRVVVLGNFDDIPSLFQQAEAVLLTSTREGLPRALVEAILARRPAFTYPCEGVADIFGAHLPAFVSRASTPGALHQVILEAWQSPPVMEAKIAELHQQAVEQFSPAAQLDRLQQFLAAPR